MKKFLLSIDRKFYRLIVGKPTIPPSYAIKREIIENYAKKFGVDIFIETGTYLGDTVDSLKDSFKKLTSIELDKELFEKAKDRFKNYSHISILWGDSSKFLPMILSSINEPILFWLDGHYSGGETAKGEANTPILKELEFILRHPIKNHVILIDDARCFIGENDYPTLRELAVFVSGINNELNFTVENDIIRITPEKNPENLPSAYREPVRRRVGELYRHFRNYFGRMLKS